MGHTPISLTPRVRREPCSRWAGSACRARIPLSGPQPCPLCACVGALPSVRVAAAVSRSALSTIASLGTLAAGYIARPLGGVIFGHFGDRLGRRSILMITMVMMGLSSAAIGLLPTYHAIGVAAPIVLVLLRIVQGIAVGGEWGGAALMVVEHADAGNRGRWAGIMQLGTPFGFLLSTAAVTIVTPNCRTLCGRWAPHARVVRRAPDRIDPESARRLPADALDGVEWCWLCGGFGSGVAGSDRFGEGELCAFLDLGDGDLVGAEFVEVECFELVEVLGEKERAAV
ncbi:MFS transporter [Nocardia cyriacigeorgica]|nr:MFS transporter [Nocardia cyriacigeorgica]MBF6552537.1 MFS transporter [Nocardia cyriacigeorgica]